jgi:hypothetical protein
LFVQRGQSYTFFPFSKGSLADPLLPPGGRNWQVLYPNGTDQIFGSASTGQKPFGRKTFGRFGSLKIIDQSKVDEILET